MIFVDSNIPMYLIGEDHPNKVRTRAALEKTASEGRKFVTNAEVFQEILHRFGAIGREGEIQLCFDALSGLVEEVFSVIREDIFAAKDLFLRYKGLSARDALHAAQMRRFKIETIFSFDTGFDILPWIKRVPNS